MTVVRNELLEARVGRGRATGPAAVAIAAETGRGFTGVDVNLAVNGHRITAVHSLRVEELTDDQADTGARRRFVFTVGLSPKRESNLDPILATLAERDDVTSTLFQVEVWVSHPLNGEEVRRWIALDAHLRFKPGLGRPIVFAS